MLRLVAALAIALSSARAEQKLARHEFESAQMGTRFRIALYAPDPTTAREAADAAFALASKLNKSFSDYDADSELMRLVKKREAIVSPELFDILTKAQKIATATDGAFDITNGPHTRNWRRARITGELPSAESIAKAKAATGWKKLKLDPATRRVTLTAEGMFLDLGGIAKGYTADAMLALLKKHDLPIATIAAGGDVSVGDPPPGEKGWKIAIAPGGKSEAKILLMANQAISTSGDAEQKLTIDGKTYSHIVDSKTGLGLTDSRPVSVVAKFATQTDAFATALSVMGTDRADAIAKKQSLRIIRPGDASKPSRP